MNNAHRFKKYIWLAICSTVLLVVTTGCADHEGAAKTLNKAGYTSVTTYSLYDTKGVTDEIIVCGEGDWWMTKFTATNSFGKNIDGIVCSGIFKGDTIRY